MSHLLSYDSRLWQSEAYETFYVTEYSIYLHTPIVTVYLVEDLKKWPGNKAIYRDLRPPLWTPVEMGLEISTGELLVDGSDDGSLIWWHSGSSPRSSDKTLVSNGMELPSHMARIVWSSISFRVSGCRRTLRPPRFCMNQEVACDNPVALQHVSKEPMRWGPTGPVLKRFSRQPPRNPDVIWVWICSLSKIGQCIVLKTISHVS